MAEGPSQPWGWRRIAPVLAPIPLLLAVFWYLMNPRHDEVQRVLMMPGMLVLPCVLAFGSPALLCFAAALFWYLGAAGLLEVVLVPRKQGRFLFKIFVVQAILVGLMLWWFSKWNVD